MPPEMFFPSYIKPPSGEFWIYLFAVFILFCVFVDF
jgi:hypothetical protein